MTEPIFFKRGGGLTVGEIAQLTGAQPHRDADLNRRITDIAQIDHAGPSDLVFLDRPQFAHHLQPTCAGAGLITERFADRIPPSMAALIIEEPYRAFVTVARALFPDAARPSSLFETEGVALDAKVHRTARIENGVTIDPGAIIGPRAEIGTGTVIAAGAVIGPNVRIGRDCAIGAGVTIVHTLIGDRVIVHPGARIGQDGYAYLRSKKGHEKIVQIGRVIIQDDVEIGANCTIDRGGIRDTVIGEGTKIDNLVQIGHNVQIGRYCLLVSQSGVSGSAVLRDYVVLAGQSGVADHVTMGEGAMLAAKSGVSANIPAGDKWMGTPAQPASEYFRIYAWLRRSSRTSPDRPATGPEKERG